MLSPEEDLGNRSRLSASLWKRDPLLAPAWPGSTAWEPPWEAGDRVVSSYITRGEIFSISPGRASFPAAAAAGRGAPSGLAVPGQGGDAAIWSGLA